MMPNKSGFYFSYYQSPNIVIVPTETLATSVQPTENTPDTATNSLSTENVRTEDYVGEVLPENPATQGSCTLENSAVDEPLNVEKTASGISSHFHTSPKPDIPSAEVFITQEFITPTSYMYQSRKNLVVLIGNSESKTKPDPLNTKLRSNLNENEIIDLTIETKPIKVGKNLDYDSLGTVKASITTYPPLTPVEDKKESSIPSVQQPITHLDKITEPLIISMQQPLTNIEGMIESSNLPIHLPLTHVEGIEPSMSSKQQQKSHFEGRTEPSVPSVQPSLDYFRDAIDSSIASIQEPITHCIDTTATNNYPIDEITSSAKYTQIEQYLEYIDSKYEDTLNFININQTKNNKDSNNKTEQFLKELQRPITEKRRYDSSHRHSEPKSKLRKHDIKTTVTYKELSNFSTSSCSLERKCEHESFNFRYETFKHKTLTETQKNNLGTGALQRYLAYQRFLGKYYRNACSTLHDVKQKESTTSHEENSIKLNKNKTRNEIVESKHVGIPSNRSETTKKKSNKDGNFYRKNINKESDKPSTCNLNLEKSKETPNEKGCDFDQKTKLNKVESNKRLSSIKENNERSKEKIAEKLERKKRKEEINKKLTRYAELKKERENAKEKLVRSLELKKYKEKSKEKLARYLELKKKKESIDKLIRKMEEQNSTTKTNKKTVKSSTSKFSGKKKKSDMESMSRVKLKGDPKTLIALSKSSNFEGNIMKKESVEKKSDRKAKQVENKRLIMSSGSIIRSSKSETKNVKSILKIANTNEKLNRYNSPSTFYNETDLRTMLSSRRTKSHSHGESNRNEKRTPQRENIFITLNQDVTSKSKPEPDLTTNKVKGARQPSKIKRIASKAIVNKTKKIKLVINIECPNSDSDDSDESASFLDDFNVDEIVDSLNKCDSPINVFNNSPKDNLNNGNIYENAEPEFDVQLHELNMKKEKLRLISIKSNNVEECEIKKWNDDEKNLHSHPCHQVIFKEDKTIKCDFQGKEVRRDTNVSIENKQLETTKPISTNTPMKPCDDDVYEVVDITDDMDTISLEDDFIDLRASDNGVEKEQSIENETIILVDDDSKDKIETSKTMDEMTNSSVENMTNNGLLFLKTDNESPENKTQRVDIPQSSTAVDKKPTNHNEAKNMPMLYSAVERENSIGIKTKSFDSTQASNILHNQTNSTENNNIFSPIKETVDTSANYTKRIEQILSEMQNNVPSGETKSQNKTDIMSKELVNSNIKKAQNSFDVKIVKLDITKQLNSTVNILPSEIKPYPDEVQDTPLTDKTSIQKDDSNAQKQNIIKSESDEAEITEQHITNLPKVTSTKKNKSKDVTNEKQPQIDIKKDLITKKSGNVINQNSKLNSTTDHNQITKPVSTSKPAANSDSTEKIVSNDNNKEALKESQKCKKSEKVCSPDKVTTTKSENKVASTKLEEKVPLLLNNPYIRGIEKRMFEYLDEKYIIMTRLHSGHFSSVYKCINQKDKTYALKVCKTGYRSKAVQKDEILKDLQKCAQKNRYFILEIINSFNSSGEWCFMTEFYPKTLEQALQENKKCFHIDLVQTLGRQLVDAVSTLMDNFIVHTDIKPSHILLNSSNDRLKLCSFDRAEYAYNLPNVILPSAGSVNYRAPEIILGFDTDYTKIDVWSTALVIFEMAAGTKLFPGRFNNDMLFKQQCTLGRIDIEMLENSVHQSMHFSGREFLRQMGPESWVLTRFYVRNKKIRNSLFNAYNKGWRSSRQKHIAKDVDKIEMLNTLLDHMLMMNPMQRILINYVASSDFLIESQ